MCKIVYRIYNNNIIVKSIKTCTFRQAPLEKYLIMTATAQIPTTALQTQDNSQNPPIAFVLQLTLLTQFSIIHKHTEYSIMVTMCLHQLHKINSLNN